MEFEMPWSGPSDRRYRLIEKYHENEGGVLFRKVNVSFPITGSRQRLPTGVRVSNLDSEYEDHEGDAIVYTENDRDKIRRFIETNVHDVELIEVFGWGYHGFGRVEGKAQAMERFWDVDSVDRTFIIDNAGTEHPFHPNGDSHDEATLRVFRGNGIKVIDGDELLGK